MSGNWAATYRLQVHQDFPLDAAAATLPYLAELGISHVYLSPCLQATPGSRHGYDVADPTRIGTDLGGEPGWARFVDACAQSGLKILLDIVPNHMSATHYNPWWDDALAHGPYSDHAAFFDIKVPAHQPFRVHLCVLARTYDEALRSGELSVVIDAGRPRLRHFDDSWPLAPASWETLLSTPSRHGAADACFAALRRLSLLPNPDAAAVEEYRRQADRAAQVLADPQVQEHLREAASGLAGDADRLHGLLEQQFYVLHGWKLAGEWTNYRRFFDVGSLVGIDTGQPRVWQALHARIETMVSRGELHGLRIDHPDGLLDPRGYFERLRSRFPDVRIYVEKILDNDERLMADWPIDGTVGYDFLAKANRLWMDDQRIDALTATYADFTGHSVDFSALVREKKRHIVEGTFSADLDRLAGLANRIARADWRTRDVSPRQVREALARVTVALGVYRSYRTANTLHDSDRRVLTEAVQRARIGSTDIDGVTFDFLLALFTRPELNDLEAQFVAEWQQLSPAVMAKGVEDTTFYNFDRLVSCNEVGAQASLIGISADKFHEFCHYLGDCWPNNLLATSTHDNKRSEDVRTRISVLSEIPDRWSEALHLWSQLNAAAWNNRTPDRHAEYLFYQTLIGAWPISPERCWQYMLKACREAKSRTSWHEPNLGYEENIRGFVESTLANGDFIASLEAFIEPLVLPGRINSLSQTLIKMLIPGVPDFYQGTELWDLSLVDPDNRRPVDFGRRRELLERCRELAAAAVLDEWDSGLPKLWLTHRLLTLRRERSEDFGMESQYQPLVARGAHLGNLLAFRRGPDLIAVVPRFTLSVNGDWGDTSLPLPQGIWRNVFDDAHHRESARPGALFANFPVSLLARDAP
jgi:(1->4)-alpha-D-glucan 1-alpha-D-glucosylmutase